MPRKNTKTLKARQRQKQRQRQSVVVNVNTTRSKRAPRALPSRRRRLAAVRRAAPQTLVHPQMRYSSEPAVYTTHVRGNAPLNPPPPVASRPEEIQAVDLVRASRDSIVAAQEAFRNEVAAAAEKRKQFDGSGMRGVGPEIALNPDREAAVAASAAGAAMVNPDSGYTELKPDLHATGPSYQQEEDEEKDEEPQQEAKSSGGFGRLRKAMGDLVGSMSPGRRPTARVVPVSGAHAIRHRREIAIAFGPPDQDIEEFNAVHADVPMAAVSSSRDLRARARRELYSETLQNMQGVSPYDLSMTKITAVARGLGIVVPATMSKPEIASAVQQVLDRHGK